MNSIGIKSSIKEEGNVKLKVVRGKKILKTVSINNKATRDLFFGIAMVLLKRTYDSTVNYSPRYLGLGKGITSKDIFTNTDLEEPLTMSRVPIRDDSSIKEAKSEVSVTFQGIVPYSSVNDQDIYEIGLFGTETGSTLLARVQLPEVLNLELGTSLIVEWTMYLKNA
jgi:hypothetical protein